MRQEMTPIGFSDQGLQEWMARAEHGLSRAAFAAKKKMVASPGSDGLPGLGDRSLHGRPGAGKIDLRMRSAEVFLKRGDPLFERPQGERFVTARPDSSRCERLGT